MLNKPIPSKCSNSNHNHFPPSLETIDTLILQLKEKDGPDLESNWEKIISDFRKELFDEVEQLKGQPSSSGNGGGGGGGGGVRAKFSVPLSRREMEKDFEDMGERRLPRKPKKRPKVVQNQLDTLFPGLWLTEIHADLYRVSETKKNPFQFVGANMADSASPTVKLATLVASPWVFGRLCGATKVKQTTNDVKST